MICRKKTQDYFLFNILYQKHEVIKNVEKFKKATKEDANKRNATYVISTVGTNTKSKLIILQTRFQKKSFWGEISMMFNIGNISIIEGTITMINPVK